MGGAELGGYGDEWFVDGESMFFNAANSNNKHDPEEVKLAKISAVCWSGGAEWRQMWEAVRPALEASRALATPPARVVNRPDTGELPAHCQLHARAGEAGGIFVAVCNQGAEAVKVEFGFHGYELAGELSGHSVRAWWAAEVGTEIASVTHELKMCAAEIV
jgi:hypothetical protein